MYSVTHLLGICVILFVVNGIEGMTSFDKAYFYGQAALDSCNNKLVQLHCYRKCGSDFTCSRGKCYCEEPFYANNVNNADDLGTIYKKIRKYVHDYYAKKNNMGPKHVQEDDGESNSFVDSTLRSEKPALRHHIAHFCPNLDIARQCIHSCMPLGKPAFCGKDHECYCGHKYDPKDKDKKRNPDDVYAEFRDLYEKYFGPNTEEQDEDHEKEDDNNED